MKRRRESGSQTGRPGIPRGKMDPRVELTDAQRERADILYARLSDLVSSNFPLERIVDMLGAHDYLEHDPKSKSADRRFHAAQWVADQVQRNQALALPELAHTNRMVVVPPDDSEMNTGGGAGSIEGSKYIPKTLYLLEVLGELGLRSQLEDGTNTPDMMRAHSYVAIIVPERKKLVLVVNEEENATFVVHEFVLTEEPWQTYGGKTKKQLKALREDGKVTLVTFWNSDVQKWKEEMRALLLHEGLLKTEPHAPREQWKGESVTTAEYAPQGWRTLRALVDELENKYNYVSLKRCVRDAFAAGKYREEESIKRYRHPVSRQELDFLSPVFCEYVKSEMIKRRPPPSTEWKTSRQVGELSGRDPLTVRRHAAKHLARHSEWAVEYQDEIHNMREHYHPELVQLLLKELGKSDT
jgi:hypothetical protein